MGLIAREIETRGIPTVSLSARRALTLLIRPPRALFTGNPNTQIVGAPNDPTAQLAILRQALRLLEDGTEPGILTEI